MKKKRELITPDRVAADDSAVEIIRVWALSEVQEMAIRQGFCEDPAEWGIILVDLARLISRSYDEDEDVQNQALERVKEGFDAEWEYPTD
ncbi:MAG: DUF5076 domain-containing protein [Sphingorhabdus sp.]